MAQEFIQRLPYTMRMVVPIPLTAARTYAPAIRSHPRPARRTRTVGIRAIVGFVRSGTGYPGWCDPAVNVHRDRVTSRARSR